MKKPAVKVVVTDGNGSIGGVFSGAGNPKAVFTIREGDSLLERTYALPKKEEGMSQEQIAVIRDEFVWKRWDELLANYFPGLIGTPGGPDHVSAEHVPGCPFYRGDEAPEDHVDARGEQGLIGGGWDGVTDAIVVPAPYMMPFGVEVTYDMIRQAWDYVGDDESTDARLVRSIIRSMGAGLLKVSDLPPGTRMEITEQVVKEEVLVEEQRCRYDILPAGASVPDGCHVWIDATEGWMDGEWVGREGLCVPAVLRIPVDPPITGLTITAEGAAMAESLRDLRYDPPAERVDLHTSVSVGQSTGRTERLLGQVRKP